MIPKPLSSAWIHPITLTDKLVRLEPLSLLPAAALVEPTFVLNPHSTLTVPQAPGLGINMRIDILKRCTLRSQRFPIVPH
jgi:hypothetical protein